LALAFVSAGTATAAATEPSAPSPGASTSAPGASAPCPAAPGAPNGCGAAEVVVTGTRTKESSQRATVRTETVTRDEAERRGARNVGEALAGEPTLQVNPQAYGYLGGPSGVQMEGLDGDRVLVLEDGERVIGDNGGVLDLSQLPLSGVERIEYVVGPTSSLYGTNALGGVINIVTAPPRFEGPSGRARLEGRTSGDWLVDSAAAYRRDKSWAELDGSYASRHEHALDGGPALLIPNGYTGLVGLRAGFKPVRRIELRLKARFARDHNDGVTTEDVPGLGTYVTNTPTTDDRLNLHALETIELGGGSHLDFSLARSSFHGEDDRDLRASPVYEHERSAEDLESFETTATLADGKTRTWVLGARGESEGFSQSVHKLEFAGSTLVPESAQEVVPQRLSSGALYGQLGYAPFEALSIMPGVRGELHDRYGGVVAPRLALAFRPSELLALRVSGGRGFRAPSAKEYGFVFDHSVLGYRVLGNPNLRPETSWGLNGDVTLRPSPALRFRAGAFANWVHDLIDFDVAPVQTDPTVVDYVYVNVDRARTLGSDLSVRAEPITGVTATLAYAYLYTRDEIAREPLPNRPPHTVTASVSAKLPFRLNALVRYRFMSKTFVTSDLDTPPYSLLDARVGYAITHLVEAYAGGLNLLNAKRDPSHPGDARPTLGATAYLGVRAEFGDDGSGDE